MAKKVTLHCPNCGKKSPVTPQVRGKLWITLVLLCFFIVPGVLYEIWRMAGKVVTCPECGKQTGWYARGAFQTDNGLVGLNLTENTLAPRVGGTVDFSLPVVRKRLDLYGELGRDTWGRDVRTLGTYFPALYQKYDLDLFLEYSDLSDFGFAYRNEFLLRAYRPINDRTYGVLALDKRDGESLRFGAGLVLQIGQ